MTTEERELVEALRKEGAIARAEWPFDDEEHLFVEAAASLIERIARERDEALDALIVKSREFYEYALKVESTLASARAKADTTDAAT